MISRSRTQLYLPKQQSKFGFIFRATPLHYPLPSEALIPSSQTRVYTSTHVPAQHELHLQSYLPDCITQTQHERFLPTAFDLAPHRTPPSLPPSLPHSLTSVPSRDGPDVRGDAYGCQGECRKRLAVVRRQRQLPARAWHGLVGQHNTTQHKTRGEEGDTMIRTRQGHRSPQEQEQEPPLAKNGEENKILWGVLPWLATRSRHDTLLDCSKW